MTRKQFFKKLPLLERNDKKELLDIVKQYAGKLSYERLYMILYVCMLTGRRCHPEAIGFVHAVMSA